MKFIRQVTGSGRHRHYDQFCIRFVANPLYQLPAQSLQRKLQADEMYICNALMPVMPVRAPGGDAPVVSNVI